MPKTTKDPSQQTGVREVAQEQLGSDKSPNEPQPKMPHERDETAAEHSSAAIENQESRDVMRQRKTTWRAASRTPDACR